MQSPVNAARLLNVHLSESRPSNYVSHLLQGATRCTSAVATTAPRKASVASGYRQSQMQSCSCAETHAAGPTWLLKRSGRAGRLHHIYIGLITSAGRAHLSALLLPFLLCLRLEHPAPCICLSKSGHATFNEGDSTGHSEPAIDRGAAGHAWPKRRKWCSTLLLPSRMRTGSSTLTQRTMQTRRQKATAHCCAVRT